MKIKITPNKKIKSQDLDEFERKIGREVPSDYKDFLKRFNGGIPESNIFKSSGKSDEVSVSTFFGIIDGENGLMRMIELYKSRMPFSVMPIAMAEGGNLICISLEDGAVYFWDHELETDDEDEVNFDNLDKLTNSFDEFLNSLELFSSEDIVLEEGQVTEAWIDPDFLKEIE